MLALQCSKTYCYELFTYYAIRHCSSVRPSVCLSRRSTAAAAVGGFAAEVGRGQQISIDSCCCRATPGPRKFWSNCNKIRHTRLIYHKSKRANSYEKLEMFLRLPDCRPQRNTSGSRNELDAGRGKAGEMAAVIAAAAASVCQSLSPTDAVRTLLSRLTANHYCSLLTMTCWRVSGLLG